MRRALSILALALITSLPIACAKRDRTVLPKPTEPLTAILSTNQVLLGQPFTLTAFVQAGPNDRIDWPSPGIPPAIVQRNARDISTGVPTGYRAQQWDLIALRPGSFSVWTGTVVRTDAERNERHLAVTPLAIQVATTLQPGTEGVRDITGLQQWPQRFATRLLYALGIVAALALVIALLARYLLQRRKTAIAPPPPVPPHIRALEALRALRARGWPDSDGIVSFYVELSNIVRRYLEGAFRMRASEQTTEEFIRAATTSRLLQLEHQQLVIAFLEQSDLVKFARHQPAQTDMEAALAAAERLVLETRPPEIAQVEIAPKKV